MIGFYMKCNSGLKWVKQLHFGNIDRYKSFLGGQKKLTLKLYIKEFLIMV